MCVVANGVGSIASVYICCISVCRVFVYARSRASRAFYVDVKCLISWTIVRTIVEGNE